MLSDSFIGQVGMRIMQRPQGKSVFSDENGEFDKEQMDAFMNKTYIENVWCFQKDKNDFDVFRHKKSISLDDFL